MAQLNQTNYQLKTTGEPIILGTLEFTSSSIVTPFIRRYDGNLVKLPRIHSGPLAQVTTALARSRQLKTAASSQ